MESLPDELSLMIIEKLETHTLTLLCRTSTRFRALTQPLIFRDFKDSDNKDNKKRVVSFRGAMKRRRNLGEYVQSISITHIEEQEVASLLIPLLIQTPNLKSLSFRASEQSLTLVEAFLKKGSLRLPKLQVFRPFLIQQKDCLPLQKWEPILCLPQLSTVLATFCTGEIRLSDTLPLEHITIFSGDLNDETITSLIEHSPSLRSFKYYSPFKNSRSLSQLNAQRISTTLSRRTTLKELWLQFPETYFFDLRNCYSVFMALKKDYDLFPKMVSLDGMSSLETLLVDQGILAKKPCLPSSLQTLIITKCYWPVTELLQWLAQATRSSLSALESIYLYEVVSPPMNLFGFPDKVKLHACALGCENCKDFQNSLWRVK